MSTVPAERQEVRAVAKWVRISPRKARLVVDHIRGRTVPEARTVLAFTTRAAAREIEKVLRSAVANAEANHGLVGDDLVVSSAHVDDGLIIKRWKPRARGRVARIKKRTCHITIKVSPVDGVVAEPKAAQPAVPAAEEAAQPPVRASGPGEGPPGEPGGSPADEEPVAEVPAAPEEEETKPAPKRRVRKTEAKPEAAKKETPKKRTLRKKKDEDT
jgi:large subunit ribosomal protein L22